MVVSNTHALEPPMTGRHNAQGFDAKKRPLWDERRAAAAYAAGKWVKTTLADALCHAAHETPERVVIVDGPVRLTCRALHEQATALAHALLKRAPTGSVVSFMLPNWHEAAVIYLGATLAGMVAHPILPSLRDRDLTFALQDSGSRFIFIPEVFSKYNYAEMASRVVTQLPLPPEVIVVRGDARGHTPFTSLLSETPTTTLPELDPDAVRMMLYTSGTTGRPKGVLHTHNSLHALIQQIGAYWRVNPGDKLLVPSPVSHIGGSIYAFECPLLLGSTAVLMDRWDAREAVRLAETEQWTHMAGATPFLEHLLTAAREAGTRLPHLKVFICGGASVPPSLIRNAKDYFQSAVVTRVYGSTETPIATVGSFDTIDHAADTDGCAGFAEIKISPHPAASAGEGEICVRSPQMLVGYLHAEDEAGAFDEEGYFRTGDLGRWQDGEYLVVTGRAKDIIIRNGENISAKEVEDILLTHPKIAEVAVVGLPDKRTGERACAVIAPAGAEPPTLQEIGAFLQAEGFAKFKTPEQIVIMDALPRNDAGKILKERLRATLASDGR